MEVVAFSLGGLMEKCEMFFRDFVADIFGCSWDVFLAGVDGKIWKQVQ